jgi:hypothetical protein
MSSERPRRTRSDARRVGILVGIGFLLLGLAWAGANPPGASPDEPANLVKAYATGNGQISGTARGIPPGTAGANAKTNAWFAKADRTYRLPSWLALPSGQVPCYAFQRDETAACSRTQPAANALDAATTQFGTYQPFLYAPMGVAMQHASSFSSADRLGRAVDVALAAAMIGWAAALVWNERRRALSISGLLLGVTPMVVFLSASVTTNGIEAAAAVLAWAALLRLTRGEPGPGSGSAWLGLAAGGGAMVLSRMLDPMFLVVMLAVVWLAARPAPADQEPSTNDATARRARMAALIVLGIAVVLSLGWTLVATAHPATDVSTSIHALRTSVTHLPNQLRQIVGIFGWNETTMPQPAYALWIILTGALVVAALKVSNWRERAALIGLGVATVLADLAIATLVEAPIGFSMQARYVLPLAVGIPMLAAEQIARRPSELRATTARWLGLVAALGAVALQAVAFLVNAHRYAVGASGGWMPRWPSSWSPDGGLGLWLAVAVVGVVLLAGAALDLFGRTASGAASSPPPTSPARTGADRPASATPAPRPPRSPATSR